MQTFTFKSAVRTFASTRNLAAPCCGTLPAIEFEYKRRLDIYARVVQVVCVCPVCGRRNTLLSYLMNDEQLYNSTPPTPHTLPSALATGDIRIIAKALSDYLKTSRVNCNEGVY